MFGLVVGVGNISNGVAFRHIKNFGNIGVLLNGEDAEKIGLTDKELTDYARLKFKNNFANIKYEDKSLYEIQTMTEALEIGRLWFSVLVVGDDYPIAYHIQCVAGSYGSGPIWSGGKIGYGSKKTVPDTIKEAISKLTEELAIDFFKVSDEM